MLSKFKSIFQQEDRENMEEQLTFMSSIVDVSQSFNHEYYKWPLEGLGECYGFMGRLESNNPFQLYTLKSNITPFDTELAEWLIIAKSSDDAIQVYNMLSLPNGEITWKKE